jgi:hypothetical protein
MGLHGLLQDSFTLHTPMGKVSGLNRPFKAVNIIGLIVDIALGYPRVRVPKMLTGTRFGMIEVLVGTDSVLTSAVN